MADQENWKREIAVRVDKILINYPQSLDRFRAQTKGFCEAYQAYLEGREEEDPLLTDAEFDALVNDDGQTDDSSHQNIPRDPIRGGEYYERPATAEQLLREWYAALAVLHDNKLKDDRRIIEDQSLYSRLVSKIIIRDERRYNKDFFETALEAIIADLQQQTGDVQKTVKTAKNDNWDDPAFIPNSEAVKLSDGRISLDRLSKILTGGKANIRHKQKGRRCKVHAQDWREYIKTLKPDSFDALNTERIAEYLAGVEERKIQEKQKNNT